MLRNNNNIKDSKSGNNNENITIKKSDNSANFFSSPKLK